MKRRALSVSNLRRAVASLVLLSSVAFGVISALAQPVLPVDHLFQNDYPEKIDNSNVTIAEQGCTLTAHTMVINYALKQEGLHKKNEDGSQGVLIQYTPAEVNTLLNNYRYEQKTYKKDANGEYVKDEHGKYIVEKVETKNGWGVTIGADGKPQGSCTNLNTGALRKAVLADTAGTSFEGEGLNATRLYAPGWKDSPTVNKTTGVALDEDFDFILSQLEAGRPAVVRVKALGDGGHTVVVSSYHADEGAPRGSGRYDIQDPWRLEDGSSIEWLDHADYDNTIYSYGARVYQTGGIHDPYAVPSDFYIDPEYLYDPLVNPDQYGPQLIFYDRLVPEPMSVLLFGSALLGLLLFRKMQNTR